MRVAKSIRNVSVMFVTQFITLVLSFVSRTIFIKTLGAEYLGLNGLFFNILSALSLAELGIGTAISYALYKPIAEDNKEQIKSLIAFYRKCYFSVGISVTAIGCLLIPFLPYLIKDGVAVSVNIINVYLCFLANSVIGYFFAHKRIIIDDTQNKYITNAIDFTSKTIVSIVQIFILMKFQNYMAFLYTQIIGTLLASMAIYFIADKKFSYIKESCDPLSTTAKKKIWSDISIIFLHKIAGVITLSSSYVIISAFVGIREVGIYSNYVLITNAIALFISLLTMGAEASIGNAVATLEKKELYVVFKKISFLIFCISGISTVCLLNLLNPFIILWIGEDYTLSSLITVAISINFFLMQNRMLVLTFKYTAGIFRPDMYKPLIEIVFCLSLSIFLVHYYGILGILIATLANIILVCIGIEAYIVHNHILKCKVWHYAKAYIIHVLALSVAYAVSFYVNNFIDHFALKCSATVSISCVVYFLFFFRTEEFKYFIRLVSSFLSSKAKPH